MLKYPKVKIDLKKVKKNAEIIKKLCGDEGIDITFVVKGCNAHKEIVETVVSTGIKSVASSRIYHFRKMQAYELPADISKMLIRIPMLSEVEDVIKYTDVSLNSEIEVISKLNDEAKKQGKKHNVILMYDLGDLREGYRDVAEIVEVAYKIETELDGLHLYGIGTNLTCYGTVRPTVEKMQELLDVKVAIENKIGRALEIVSGGSTTTLPLVVDKTVPSGINNLRIGAMFITAFDINTVWNCNLDEMDDTAITLEAEVIEIKLKPTKPIGELMLDGFGLRKTFEDRGNKVRALLGVGKQDYGLVELLRPMDENIQVIGASSDHTIIEFVDERKLPNIGDIISFELNYANMLYLFNMVDMEIDIC